MDSSYVENVLAEIEEEFQGIEEVDEAHQIEKEDSPDKAIEDYDVVDSWEIGAVDDVHHSDVSYWKDKRRSRGSSYSRSDVKQYRSRDVKYDRTRKIPRRRYHGRSDSKSGGSHFSLGSSRERVIDDKESLEHLRVSVRNSPIKDMKLPDLKCTTSVETGEINVVLLPDDTNADNSQDEREKSVSDGVRKRLPTLVKNPFACSTFRKKLSSSPDQVRKREYETSSRNSQEGETRERQNRGKNDRENHGTEILSMETLSGERCSMEPLTISRERLSREPLSRERCSRESRSRKRHSREPLSRERWSREPCSRERHSRESLSRERHSKETRLGERPSRETRSRERITRGSRDTRPFDFPRDRSLSPIRSRSNHRTSPYFYDRKIRRRSTSHSPERYFRRSRDYRKSRESSRGRSRSREGSLSQVSTKSSLSLLSMRGGSPREHDRKKSPLRPYKFCDDPRQRDPNYFCSSDEFNNKLTLLLKERKQKQSEMYDDAGPSQSSNYSNDAWKAYNWNSTGNSPYPPVGLNTNVSADSVYKSNSNVNSSDYTGYNQGSYNQVYYNNNQPQYSNAFAPNMDNFYQHQFSFPPPPMQGQYFPQPPVTMDFRSNIYTGPQAGMQYQNINTSQQEPFLSNLVQLQSVVPQQDYNAANVVQPCSGINTVPEMKIPSITSTVSKKRDAFSKSSESSSKTNKRIPTRTSIPLDTNKNHINEEDPMRTPPPPMISDTWKDIDFAEKSLWKGENKKWEVFSKCEQLLQKVMSNDPSMEQFKISRCKSVMPFTVKEEANLTSQSAVQDDKQTPQLNRFRSSLKKKTNPDLKWSWI